MQPLLDDLVDAAKGLSFSPPVIPVVSGVHGTLILPGDGSVFDAEYIGRHCVEPVLFAQGISALLAIPEFANAAAWVELGPDSTCLPLLKGNPAFLPHVLLLGSMRKRQDAWTTLSESLEQLYLSNIHVLWRQTLCHVSTTPCSVLPSYPFSTTDFWVNCMEISPSVPTELGSSPSHLISTYSVLRSWSQFPSATNGWVAIFETPIDHLAELIDAHTVGGFHLCPASVYLEQVLAGINLSKEHMGLAFLNDIVVFTGVEFIKPLVHVERISRIIKTSITLCMDGSGTFTISSLINGCEEDSVHVHGNFYHQSAAHVEMECSDSLPFVVRQMAAIARSIDGTPPETFSTRTIYELIFPRVVEYGAVYRTIQSLTVDANIMEGSATIELPGIKGRIDKFVVHPAFMDSLFHVAGFMANAHGGRYDAYICTAVGSMRVIPELVNDTTLYAVYCCNVWVPEDGIMLADTYAVLLTAPKRIVAHLKGLQFRRVRFDTFKRGLGLAAASHQSLKTADLTSMAQSPLPHFWPSCPNNNGNAGLVAEVTQIVSLTCGIDSAILDVRTDLASLGVDSLLTIEIFYKLRGLYPHNRLNAQSLAFCNTITEIVEVLRLSPTLDLSGISSSSTLIQNDSGIGSDTGDQGDPEDFLKVMPSVWTGNVSDTNYLDVYNLNSTISTEPLHNLTQTLQHDLLLRPFATPTTGRQVQSFPSNDLPNTLPGCAAEAAKALTAHVIEPESIVKAFRLGDVPVSIQKSSKLGHFPLFLIHDGSGLISYYDRLSPLGRDVWGIHNPHFVKEIPWPWDSLRSMAAEYTTYVLKITTDPVLIGGKLYPISICYASVNPLIILRQAGHSVV